MGKAKDRGMYEVPVYCMYNRLHAHVIGLAFNMYCNDNVEDVAYSNCIERDGIEIPLSRVLLLMNAPLPEFDSSDFCLLLSCQQSSVVSCREM